MTIQQSLRSIVLWTFGGTIYFICEVIWKTMNMNAGSISWTMLILASIICIPLDQVNEHLPWTMPLVMQAFLGGLGITITEFIVGIILNIHMGLHIWNYSNLPFNIYGQICLSFFLLWVLVSGIGIVVFDWLRYYLYNEKKPKYVLF